MWQKNEDRISMASIYPQEMWTTSMLKILTWILSSGPLGKGKHNMLNAQFAACFKCVTTLNIRLQELTSIHQHYFTATTICLVFVFLWKFGTHFRLSMYLYVLWKLFSKKIKIKSNVWQENVRVHRLVFCYYSLRKLDWAEMAPCP